MLKIVAPLIATIALAWAGSAHALIHVTLQGKLTSELSYAEGPDPKLEVGSNFVIRARFDENLLTPYDSDGSVIADLYGLNPYGEQMWRMEAGGIVWETRDDLFDGDFGSPSIVLKDGKVTAVIGWMYPGYAPIVDLGSGGVFRVEPGQGFYANLYPSQGFLGTWDYAGSTVASYVPEPSAWAMMIMGFGLAGTALRRRARPLAV